MIFTKTKIEGAYVVSIDTFEDERGSFSNLWNSKIFNDNGLDLELFECNLSDNLEKGTLRGLHYQIHPYDGSKLVGCIHGKIYDVILDLRKNSITFEKWIATELNNSKTFHLVPSGCAHGFLTLEDNSKILYLMSQVYNPNFSKVAKWDDKKYNIKWPIQPKIISIKDS